MNLEFRSAAALAVSVLLVCAAAGAPAPTPDADGARRATASWPDYSRDLAAVLVLEYGAPDRIEASRLTWIARPPWARMIVFRDPLDDSRANGLLQAVAYDAPRSRRRALDVFDRGVSYDPAARELVVRTDGEESNLLALNLADEVLRGVRSAADARAFNDKTLSLAFSGKSSAYMRRLLFRPRRRTAVRALESR